MFDLSFIEIIIIGVVALIVVGPERLPKVARTAGHLYGRAQRYVSAVKSDISREIQAEELLRVGREFKESVGSVAQSVEQEATVVDDFLRKETSNLDRVMGALGSTEGERQVTAAAFKASAETKPDQASLDDAPFDNPQQSLALDEPESDTHAAPVKPADTEKSA